MEENIAIWATIWLACGAATIVAALFATQSRRWLYAGRIATGVLFTLRGALVHVINVAAGGDYADFADPAHFAWVTDAWRAVVPGNHLLLIGLLAVFEATVGVLVMSGGRRTLARVRRRPRVLQCAVAVRVVRDRVDPRDGAGSAGAVARGAPRARARLHER